MFASIRFSIRQNSRVMVQLQLFSGCSVCNDNAFVKDYTVKPRLIVPRFTESLDLLAPILSPENKFDV